MSIQIRAPRRQLDGIDSDCGENAIECGAKLRIPIVQQVPTARQKARVSLGDVSGHLLHPSRIGGCRYAGNVYLPRGHAHEGQHVIGQQAADSPDFSRKEINRRQDFRVRTNEIPPRRLLFPFRRWQ